MKSNRQVVVIATSILLIILILDTETSVNGAKAGIDLCLNCIIPSLFPLSFLSKVMCGAMAGHQIPFASLIHRITRIPKGAESIFLISLIGGYPVGALCINDAYKRGILSKIDCGRLMAFCNNAGPAFIFGVLYLIFPSTKVLWALYLIHIISALMVSLIFPVQNNANCEIKASQTKISKIMEDSIKSMACICTWIVLFKILITLFQRWFSRWLSPIAVSVVTGFLELSNGSVLLQSIENNGLRFIFASAFLGFGGLCVAFQTQSVVTDCGIGMYFPGKILHALIGISLSALAQFFIFDHTEIYPNIKPLIGITCILIALTAIFIRKSKKVVAFT